MRQFCRLNRFAKVLIKGLELRDPGNKDTDTYAAIDYNKKAVSSPRLAAIILGYFLAGLIVFLIFYRSFVIGITAAMLTTFLLVPLKINSIISQRKKQLRRQFLDLLAALDVAMRAGENINRAFNSALESLLLVYNENCDIIIEIRQILMWLENNKTLKESLNDFAERCDVEEIKNFATVIEIIEGRSDRSNDVIRQTHKVIAEAIEIEMEIETLIADKKNEQIIMLILPVLIVGVMTWFGNGFMDAIHTTSVGRLVATISIVIFIGSYFLSLKITSIDV